MPEDGPRLSGPKTPQEAERLAVAQAQLDEINSQFEGVTATVGYLDDEETITQIDATEAAVFVSADGYSWFKGGGLPLLPSVEIHGLEYLEKPLREGRLLCTQFGIGKQIEGVDVGLFALFRLIVGLRKVPLYIWLADAPDGWLEHALKRFVVTWPPGEDGQCAYMATGPMHQFPEGVRVAPDLGRNDPCPCGSAVKFKRCHGK